MSSLAGLSLPPGVIIRPFATADFLEVQALSTTEGWPTPVERPAEALLAWQNAWPALVAVDGTAVIGFLRAITDGAVSLYLAELLVAPAWRRRGVATLLLEVCHRLYPTTRIDLLATASSQAYYQANGFRPFAGFRKSF